MPVEVEFAVSSDGVSFTTVGTLANDVAQNADGAVIKDFAKDGLQVEARYVRVRAKNPGALPSWHGGAGHPAWIFCDEIVIE